MPWPLVVQLVAPYGVELIEYVIGLVQKEAKGQPLTPADWKGLATLHASKTAEQQLVDAEAPANP